MRGKLLFYVSHILPSSMYTIRSTCQSANKILIFKNKLIITDRLQNDSEENIQTIPTIGFNVEVLQYKNIKFQESIFNVCICLSVCLYVCMYVCMYVALSLYIYIYIYIYILSMYLVFKGMGSWWPDEHPTLLALLLSQYWRYYFRGWFVRWRAFRYC